MSRLFLRPCLTLFGALLGAAASSSQARPLESGEPLRVALVSLARQTPHPSTAAGAKLSVRRAWADGSQAQLCALTMDESGAPIMSQGRYQLRKVAFERSQGKWRVQRSHVHWLPSGESGSALDALCPRPDGRMTAPTQVAQAAQATQAVKTAQAARSPSRGIELALAEMARHPPTAGLPNSTPAPSANIANAADAACAAPATALPEAASWPAGHIVPAGRSHLFTAPNSACRMGKHLVQNDKVRIGATRSGWTQVRYTHPITQVVTLGWLPRQKVSAQP